MRAGWIALLLFAMCLSQAQATARKSPRTTPSVTKAMSGGTGPCDSLCAGHDKMRKRFSSEDRFESVPMRPTRRSGGFGG